MHKMNLKIITTGVLLLTMAALTACKEEVPVHPLNLEHKAYEKMIESTIVSTGNNYRLKKVIQKMKNGEEVYIAALGGSVTEGAGPKEFTDGYAYQFFRALQAKYNVEEGKNLHFNDAGLSGSGSQVGIVRYQSDVVDFVEHEPDLLIIEFAVNDDGNETTQRCFEALVRAALKNPETAVIAMYSAATYGNTMGMKKPVADYYSLPQINMLDLVNDSIKNKVFTKEQFYSDYVHPTFEGHEMMKDALMLLVKKAEKGAKDAEIAVPNKLFKAPGFDNFVRILGDDENVKITKGVFSEIDPNCQSLKKTNKSDFPINWKKKNGSKGESFKMDINCKNMIFIFKVQGSWDKEKFGKAEVYVDGKLFNTYDGGAQGGWNNCEPRILIDTAKAENHTVEVKMAAGDEEKGFTIVAMGYSK